MRLPLPFVTYPSHLHPAPPSSSNSTTSTQITEEDAPLHQQHRLPPPTHATQTQLNQLLRQIALRWTSLSRSTLSILDLVKDPKLATPDDQPYRLYVNTTLPGDETLAEIRERITRVNPRGDMDRVEVIELPSSEQIFKDNTHGALYLPYPYVVPGGVFQEMYAWDSFFIALGLIRDKEVRLARNMLDNYIYQIEHYGKILNGNRSYYLNRSQLPFFTQLVKLIYPTVAPSHAQAWLRQAVRAAEKYHEYWTTGDHLVKETGLSRFFDSSAPGTKPPEIAHETEQSNGSTAYDRVRKYFKEHYQEGIPDYDIQEYYDLSTDTLKGKFMDNDRAMRESGFDTSTRFGPFNSKILDFNPVCLNALLAQMEAEIGELYGLLRPGSVTQAKRLDRHANRWKARSIDRIQLIRRYNWDEQDGFYYDYDFVRRERRRYVFGTAFLPLWTGIATTEEAMKVVERGLESLEAPGGLATSAEDRGDQWDRPYGWAPLQMFAVEGMARYGFKEAAERVAVKFGSMVLKTWIITDELWEKYDVLRRDEHVDLKFGYPTNEIGFGWTNAVFTRFHDWLPPAVRSKLLELDGQVIQQGAEESLSSSWVEGVAKLSAAQRAELIELLLRRSKPDSDEDWVKVVKEE